VGDEALIQNDLQFTEPASDPYGSSALTLSSRPKRTRIFYNAAPIMASCAAFRKEIRMELANATKLYRKSGVAQWRDLQFTEPASDPYGSSALPLSSRLSRRAVGPKSSGVS
jgi:hypothetical protein